jgi:hypothetical protein
VLTLLGGHQKRINELEDSSTVHGKTAAEWHTIAKTIFKSGIIMMGYNLEEQEDQAQKCWYRGFETLYHM